MPTKTSKVMENGHKGQPIGNLLIGCLAFAVPFVVSTVLLGPAPGWLDSPELTAASASLGLSHPPGHPAYLLFSHLFSLIPIGSLPFRVALFSSFCLGVASWLAYRSALQLQASVIGEHVLAFYYRCLTCIPTIFACLTYTVLLQGVRPEVYTFHAALGFGVFERMLSTWRGLKLRTEQELSDEDAKLTWGVAEKPFYSLIQAALLFGLGLANHHYLMLFTVPGCVWLLAWMWRSLRIDRKQFLLLFFAVSVGLSSYAYLPARSISQTPIHWGAAHTVKGFVWQVTAKAWQRSVQPSTKHQPIFYRFLTLSSIYFEQFGLGCVLAIFGFYLMFRMSFVAGGLVFLWGAGVFVGRLLMHTNRLDADLHGYLTVSMFLFVWCCSFLVVLIGARCSTFHEEHCGCKWNDWFFPIARGFAVLLVLIPFAQIPQSLADAGVFSPAHCDRRHQVGPLLWAALMEEPLPYGTLLLTNYYQNGFLFWYRKFIERQRPDIQVIQRNLMTHRAIAQFASKQNPKLAKVLLNLGPHPKVAFGALQLLTKKRNICFEWWQGIPQEVVDSLVPIGMFFCWFPEREGKVSAGNLEDDLAIREQQSHFWKEVYSLLTPRLKFDREHRNLLLWTHFQHALFYKQSKRWHAGLAEVHYGLKLFPRSLALKQLSKFFSGAIKVQKKTATPQ